jgi:hypothetical protein
MLLYFFIISLMLFVTVSIIANYNARIYSREVIGRIRKMEQIYMDFIQKKVDRKDFNSFDLYNDPELLAKDAVIQLNPSLEGLINYINKAYLSKVKIRTNSTFFPNISALCEEAFANKNKNPEKRMSLAETERFRMALYDAVHADIFQRITGKQDEKSILS